MSASSLSLRSRSERETEQLGAALFAWLPSACVVALFGDLAAGKTCLVRGIAEAAEATEPVSSPTFVVVNEYHGSATTLNHLDLYRLSGIEELVDVGCEELFEPRDSITLVEWAERAEALLPGKRVEVRLRHAGGDSREIEIRDYGVLGDGWAQSLERALPV